MHATYGLRLPPAAVRDRLVEETSRPSLRYWVLPGTTTGRPIVGEINGDRFWWRVRHRSQASLAPWMTGRIEGAPIGSMVVIHVRTPLTPTVWAVIVGLLLALAGIFLAAGPIDWPTGLLLAGVAIGAVALVPAALARLYAHEEYILRQSFEAMFASELVEISSKREP